MSRLNNINFLNWLLIINFGFFVLVQIVFALLDRRVSETEVAYLLGGLSNASIVAGEYWTIVTSNFLHINILHLLLNMFALYQVGRLVLMVFDQSVVFITYMFTGIVASIASLVLYGFFGINFISVGASGSIFGLVGLLIGASIFYSIKKTPFPFTTAEFLPTILLPLAILFLGFNFINHYAHFGGLISGIFIGFIYPQIRYSKKLNTSLSTLSLLILFISIATFFLSLFFKIFINV